MTVEVRRAESADVDGACSVLADAFTDYPWTRWTIDADRHAERIEALQRLCMTRLALPYGEVWLACDGRANVLSVAIWMLPDSSVPEHVLQEVIPTQASLEGARHRASLLAEAHVAPLRPTAPHYYLGAVGTRRDCQRQGHASSVLAPILARADHSGEPAFLETSEPTNRDFYGRLGFVTTTETRIPEGGPPVWVMRRVASRPPNPT